MPKKTVGEQLRALREQFGIKAVDVCERVEPKLDPGMLSRIEHGRRTPDAIRAEQIRNAIYDIAKERLANLPEAV
jgi:transcriptional regulator with XRE-family HTH domain